MDHHLVLPTPPRSPAPPNTPQKIKLEKEDNYLNHQDLQFDDIFSLLPHPQEGEEEDQEGGVEFEDLRGHFGEKGRKRKISGFFPVGVEFEQLLRDLPPLSGLQNFDITANSLLDSLISNLDTTTPPPTRPPSPLSNPIDDDPTLDYPFIKQELDNFDTFEFNDFLSTFSSPFSPQQPPPTSPVEPPQKRQKYSSTSSSTDLLNNDCFLFEEEEEVPPTSPHSLEHLRLALNNDHNYCQVEDLEENVVIDGVEIGQGGMGGNQERGIYSHGELLNFDNIPKKTKILVPLKSLMKTLQQKSFLVSSVGPGKKVIRLGRGESVKGVLQSTTALLSSQSYHSPKSHTPSTPTNPPTTPTHPPQNHNVRKRPHSNLLLTKLHQMDSEPTPTSSSSPTITSGLLPLKKKTKAHNNMERMRRIDLRNSFDNLKKLVPILAKSPKCSKVEILKRAEEYVRGLRGVEKKLVKEETLLKVKMQELKSRLGNCSGGTGGDGEF